MKGLWLNEACISEKPETSVTQHAMPRKFGEIFGMEYLNTRVPLPALLHAGYSVKLKIKTEGMYVLFTII